MTKKEKTKVTQPSELARFKSLQKYAERVAQGEMRKGRYFALCVRASFAKCYEFNLHAWDELNAESAFFWLPTLRGICEDLIVLNYIQRIPHSVRDPLIADMMIFEIDRTFQVQGAFFEKARPQQPCLRANMSGTQREALEVRIRKAWQSHGWPNMRKGVMPPVRQIAEKDGGDILATLYDYLYRMTSETVHFNARGLLRTGWGDIPHCVFSPKHFTGYYKMCGRIYGAFLFCTYFELLARFIRSDKTVRQTVSEIRKSILLASRWPEMATFEEMNLKPPPVQLIQHAISFMQSETRQRLIRRQRR